MLMEKKALRYAGDNWDNVMPGIPWMVTLVTVRQNAGHTNIFVNMSERQHSGDFQVTSRFLAASVCCAAAAHTASA